MNPDEEAQGGGVGLAGVPSDPYWMRDDPNAALTPSQGAPMVTPPPLYDAGGADAQAGARPEIVWGFRVLHFGLAVMMAATGALSIAQFDRVNSHQLSEFFVSFYLLMFAALWFTFEVVQIRPVEVVTYHLKRNFGFLYGNIGKALFIIFIAFLNFGVQEETLGLVTGILCIIDGVLLILLYIKYPHLHPSGTKT